MDSRWVVLDDKSRSTPVTPVIDRASATDLMELVSDTTGCPMQVAAILVLDSEPTLEAVRRAVAERIRAVPRMRQILVRAPLGCGRPIWVDYPEFNINHHIGEIPSSFPIDETEMLYIAAELYWGRLHHDRPLWSATLITGMEGGRAALVVVFHHVLADGIGGLAVLARLVDGAPPGRVGEFPRPSPGRRMLFADALRSRLRAVRQFPAGVRRLRAAAAELGLSRKTVRAPRCSLNRPVKRRRALAVARTDLAAVRAVGHRHHGTVNDVVLTAVAGALGRLLEHRGETVEQVVVSVPVSARMRATATQLGNQVGVIPVALPVGGDPFQRLTTIVDLTRQRKTAARGASAALLAPAFRLLARFGMLRWYVRHQHLVNTFVTNVRGPQTELSFLGIPVRETIPVGLTTGNVTVSFAVLSYAGKLVMTLTADPETCPDYRLLQAELQTELDTLTNLDPASGGSWKATGE